MRNLIASYKTKKGHIRKRLRDFKKISRGKNEDIFAELCFCIMTPQSKAVSCDKAIKNLRKQKLLLKGCENKISGELKGLVRFHNKKSSYLVEARNIFTRGNRLDIKNKLKNKNAFLIREWLVSNIKGLGYKEASHFLRNTGLGQDMAILDVHILRNLKKFSVIPQVPSSLGKKTYLEIEEKMRRFSRKIKIPMEELDLLFWSNQTGFIFK